MRFARIRIAAMLLILPFAFTSLSAAQEALDRFPSRSQIEQLELREAVGDSLGFTNGSSPRSMLSLGFELLKDFEGWVPIAYDDPVGYCTVGYGHLIALKKCGLLNPAPYPNGLTKGDGEKLLDEDTAFARRAVQSLVDVTLTDAEFSALASFVFNVGRDNFKTSTLRELINQGELTSAARQFGRWVNADGKKQPGLVTRRECERLLFVGALELDASGKFSRKPCEILGIGPVVDNPIDIEVGE